MDTSLTHNEGDHERVSIKTKKPYNNISDSSAKDP